MAQWAEVIFADLLLHGAVFAHGAHPELKLLDGPSRHDARRQLSVRPAGGTDVELIRNTGPLDAP